VSASDLVSRLEGVRQTGHGRWTARCPAHEDRRASLSVRELDDGRVLVHDFAGCDVEAVLSALGLEMGDLYPEKPMEHGKRERRPFNAHDVLACVAFEATVVAVSARDIASGKVLTEAEIERLWQAAGRIEAARRIANGK
jgi:hypothetical protein